MKSKLFRVTLLAEMPVTRFWPLALTTEGTEFIWFAM
jgi:hypothetical protein